MDDSSAKKEKASGVETITLSRVPDEKRKSWIMIALIQAGVMICVPSLMLGGLLVNGMTIVNAIIAGAIGYGIAVVLMTLMAIQGHDLGVPTVVCASSAFGKSGSRVILSSLFVFSLIGWFAVQTNVCGSAFSNLMNIAFGVSIPVWMSSVIWGLVMLSTAAHGITALGILNYLSLPPLALLSIYGAYMAIAKHGTSALFDYHPQAANAMSMLDGVSLTLGFLCVGIVLAADFTRYQRTRKDTVKSTVFGILPAGLGMLILGTVMALVAGTYDITAVLGSLGVPILGAIVLVFATWHANTTNAYSAGIDLVMLFNLPDSKRSLVTIISGIVGTILGAVGIMTYFQSFLNWSGYLFLPIAGIMTANYFVLLKGKAENWKEKEGFDFIAILSWGVGCTVSIVITSGFPMMYGFITSFVLYLALNLILKKNKDSDDKDLAV